MHLTEEVTCGSVVDDRGNMAEQIVDRESGDSVIAGIIHSTKVLNQIHFLYLKFIFILEKEDILMITLLFKNYSLFIPFFHHIFSIFPYFINSYSMLIVSWLAKKYFSYLFF